MLRESSRDELGKLVHLLRQEAPKKALPIERTADIDNLLVRNTAPGNFNRQ